MLRDLLDELMDVLLPLTIVLLCLMSVVMLGIVVYKGLTEAPKPATCCCEKVDHAPVALHL